MHASNSTVLQQSILGLIPTLPGADIHSRDNQHFGVIWFILQLLEKLKSSYMITKRKQGKNEKVSA